MNFQIKIITEKDEHIVEMPENVELELEVGDKIVKISNEVKKK